MPTDLERAKAQLRIDDVWHLLGLPGEPGSPCSSPFRRDRHPSFSVFDDGRRWMDFATDEGGDVVDFVAEALGVGLREASRELMRMARRARLDGTSAGRKPERPLSHQDSGRWGPRRHGDDLPDGPPRSAQMWAGIQDRMRIGSNHELEQLARLRCLPDENGVMLASIARQLYFVPVTDDDERVTAWLVTDPSRRCAQLRRLDGQPWRSSGCKAKTVIAEHGGASWPVGAAGIGDKPHVALVEGGPDLLAAWHFAHLCRKSGEVAPVAMMGARMRIHDAAVPLLRGRGVWIFAHNDGGTGAEAADRWLNDLLEIGAAWVEIFDFGAFAMPDGRAVKDLNDLARCKGFGEL